MREQISLVVNGKLVNVDTADVGLTLSDWLRQRKRLSGTKVVCAEGDCGACSVLCADALAGEPFTYRAIDSCIRFMYQLDGTHVITVEGLSIGDGLYPVQQAMVKHFGSQCGFCTPGFVNTLTAVAQSYAPTKNQLEEYVVKRELTGNLCRCTGYQQIIEAACSIDLQALPSLAELYDENSIVQSLQVCRDSASVDEEEHTTYLPVGLQEAIELRKTKPDAVLVAGATDLGVQHNKQKLAAGNRILLTRVSELQDVSITDTEIIIGAAVNWHDVRSAIAQDFPCFDELLDLFGSPQIRNVGTLGGNLMNASPIADSIPFLMVTDAVLEAAGPDGTRSISIEEFYTGYKQTVLDENEILVRVRIPRVHRDDDIELLKVSQRRDMDISTVTCALRIKLKNNVIEEARMAFGGVGPIVHRLPQTESLLCNEPLTLELFEQAGVMAVTEVKPVSDVRGSNTYRLQLVKNALSCCAHRIFAKRNGVTLPSTSTAVSTVRLQH